MIRIAIVDDHPLVRTGLRHFLDEQTDISVVAEAENGRQAMDIARDKMVDVMLMDVAMPLYSGVDALAAIHAREPKLSVLMLSGYPEEHYATTLIRQGASGYLNKSCDPEELLKAIRTVACGRKYLTDTLAHHMACGLSHDSQGTPLHESLSTRELQVFLRLAQGKLVGGIAVEMSLSIKTISTYRTRVMEKMCMKSNSDLTYYAMKHMLIG